MATPARAIVAIADDELMRSIVGVFASRPTASGWSIAKELNRSPQEVRERLEHLRQLAILKVEGTGLEGFYFLTALGQRIRADLSI